MNKNHDAKGRFASGSSGGSSRKGAPKSVIHSKYGTTRSTSAEVAKRNFMQASRKKGPETRTWANGGFSGTAGSKRGK